MNDEKSLDHMCLTLVLFISVPCSCFPTGNVAEVFWGVSLGMKKVEFSFRVFFFHPFPLPCLFLLFHLSRSLPASSISRRTMRLLPFHCSKSLLAILLHVILACRSFADARPLLSHLEASEGRTVAEEGRGVVQAATWRGGRHSISGGEIVEEDAELQGFDMAKFDRPSAGSGLSLRVSLDCLPQAISGSRAAKSFKLDGPLTASSWCLYHVVGTLDRLPVRHG